MSSFDPNALLHICPLRGRALRYVLLARVRRRSEVTVAELVTDLLADGYVFAGRPSKLISDALRWEVRGGRVERLERGRYRYRSANRSRLRRAELLARRCGRWLEAVARGEPPPRLLPDRRPNPFSLAPGSGWPPWIHLGWLWCR